MNQRMMLGIATLVACVLSGCRVSVHGPPDVEQPQRILLAEYDDFHTSLVVPGDGDATEFTYGDFDLYARYDRSLWPIIKGLFFPTQGALGRRTVPWDGTDLESLGSRLGCNRFSAIDVETATLTDLTTHFHTTFDVASETTIENTAFGLTFVEYPRRYTFFHNNCNHQLAAWLEELGCRVGWGRVLARFHVADSSPTPN